MATLEDFEKQLAEDKAEREQDQDRKHRKHRHREDRHRHRGRDRDGDRDGERRHKHREEHNKDKHGRREPENGRGRDRDGGDRRRRRDDPDDKHRERRHRHEDDNSDNDRSSGHRHKRRREERDEKNEKNKSGTVAVAVATGEALSRDSWMVSPSALDIDYTQRGQKKAKTPPKPEPKRVMHEREINRHLDEDDTHSHDHAGQNDEESKDDNVEYTFGDEGSQWRIAKLQSVYITAEETGRTVESVALERFGTLREFDGAREEKIEVDRRKTYGEGYMGKEKPTGELYKERKAKEPAREQLPTREAETESPFSHPEPVDQSTLNKLKAQLMRAKMRNAPNVAELEAKYNAAVSGGTNKTSDIVLGAMDSRQLAGARGEVKTVDTKRGRERGLVEQNDEMTIDDMIREERRTRGQAGGEGMRLAERIAKDSKFDNDLEYLDENAEKLAKRVHKSSINLKNMAIGEFQKVNRILDNCPLCHHEEKDEPPIAPVVSLGTRAYLTVTTQPEICEGGAVIAPLMHHRNLLECDDDEWEEIRNFMKCLTRLYHEQGREVLFYENAAYPHRHGHAAMVAVPIPYELGDTAPAFFREAMVSADEEWSQHKKVIDTAKRARTEGLGKMAFRRSIAKEVPYFHVWFTLDGGLGHVVEDEGRWPKGDLFAREVIGGMVDAEPQVIKKQGWWSKSGGDDTRVEEFKKRWRKFDWTRALTDG